MANTEVGSVSVENSWHKRKGKKPGKALTNIKFGKKLLYNDKIVTEWLFLPKIYQQNQLHTVHSNIQMAIF